MSFVAATCIILFVCLCALLLFFYSVILLLLLFFSSCSISRFLFHRRWPWKTAVGQTIPALDGWSAALDGIAQKIIWLKSPQKQPNACCAQIVLLTGVSEVKVEPSHLQICWAPRRERLPHTAVSYSNKNKVRELLLSLRQSLEPLLSQAVSLYIRLPSGSEALSMFCDLVLSNFVEVVHPC